MTQYYKNIKTVCVSDARSILTNQLRNTKSRLESDFKTTLNMEDYPDMLRKFDLDNMGQQLNSMIISMDTSKLTVAQLDAIVKIYKLELKNQLRKVNELRKKNRSEKKTTN